MSDVNVDDVDDDSVDDDDLGNRVDGGSARNVLDYLARAIVDEPEAVVIDSSPGRNGKGITLRLHVAPDDMGKIIGKRGRVVQSIRTIVRAAGAADGEDVNVDVVD